MEQTHTKAGSCCGINNPDKKHKLAQAKRSARNTSAILHPDHSSQVARLNRVIGQIEGIKRMIQTRRYCPEILVQTRAIASALKAVEVGIIEKHVRHCVSEALAARKPKEIDRKIEELVTILDRF